MSWNGFSANVRTSIILRLKSKYNVNSNEHYHTATEKIGNDLIDDIRPKIWTRMPFLGKQGGFLVGLKRFYRKYSVISQKRRSNLF